MKYFISNHLKQEFQNLKNKRFSNYERLKLLFKYILKYFNPYKMQLYKLSFEQFKR